MDDDLLRELAAADPVRGRVTSATNPSARRALASALRQKTAAPRRSRSRPSRAWLAVPALALALVGAAWWVLEPEEALYGIACFQEASGESSAIVVAPSLLLDGSPEEVCAHVWSRTRTDGPQPPEEGATADSLTSCVREDGNLVVVPGAGRGPCRDLGWAPASITERTLRIGRLDELLDVQESLRGGCRSRTDAEAHARDVLERLGLDEEWAVEHHDPSEAYGPCHRFVFDPPSRTIYVQPRPPIHQDTTIDHR